MIQSTTPLALVLVTLTIGCSGGSSGSGGTAATLAAAAGSTAATSTGSSSALPTNPASPTPSTPQGWAGAYTGTYQGAGDAGQVLFLAFPDGTLAAWAASSQDPTRRDVLLGGVDSAGRVGAQVGLLGTTFQADLVALQGSYEGAPLTLTRSAGPGSDEVYIGSVINETHGEGGVWSALVSPQGQVTALMAYPRLGHVSERLDGQVDASGQVSLSSVLDTASGAMSNGLAAGRWEARDGSQRGSWHGFRGPRAQSSPASGLAGAYHGTYADDSGADRGRVIVVVYPDRSFLAVAVSEVDPSRADGATGVVASDGSVVSYVTFHGTSFSGNLTTSGRYGGPSQGSFQVARAAAGESIHAGVHLNTTFGVAGVWLAAIDGQGGVAGASAYPSHGQLDGLLGVAQGDTLSGSNPLGDQIQGRAENALSGGSWSSPRTGQAGRWTGFRLP